MAHLILLFLRGSSSSSRRIGIVGRLDGSRMSRSYSRKIQAYDAKDDEDDDGDEELGKVVHKDGENLATQGEAGVDLTRVGFRDVPRFRIVERNIEQTILETLRDERTLMKHVIDDIRAIRDNTIGTEIKEAVRKFSVVNDPVHQLLIHAMCRLDKIFRIEPDTGRNNRCLIGDSSRREEPKPKVSDSKLLRDKEGKSFLLAGRSSDGTIANLTEVAQNVTVTTGNDDARQVVIWLATQLLPHQISSERLIILDLNVQIVTFEGVHEIREERNAVTQTTERKISSDVGRFADTLGRVLMRRVDEFELFIGVLVDITLELSSTIEVGIVMNDQLSVACQTDI